MAKYIDLIEKLTDRDKATINAYVAKYGCAEEYFIGVENWLENWSHANQKLYKLLGEKFICEFPFEYEKGINELRKEMEDLYYGGNGNDFRCNYNSFISWIRDNQDEFDMDNEIYWSLNRLVTINTLTNNKINDGFKYKKPNGKKMLQIQAGAKLFRAVNQIMNYFPEFGWDKNAFEEFRKKHAIIFSEKMIKGTACISIHPLDFMTMSDNDSNWTSCMSWRNDGCYHVGTVEMMNSNNVVCCYLKNNTPYVFDEKSIDPDTGEIIGVWNNKRWRQLIYVTKDIIMSGKPYPYVALDLTKKVLEEAKNLAETNLNWTYQFGPERYKDMEWIGSLSRMEKQRNWMRNKSFKKHNIIWDTHGMYNDMLNDHGTAYMCYRNKVDHTKIISVSGKANCLCCNQPVLEYNDHTYEYNDRYNDTGMVICPTCVNDYFRCSWCNETHTNSPMIRSDKNGAICPYCFERRLKVCPCCGKPMYIEDRLHAVFTNRNAYDLMHKDEYGMEYVKQQIEGGDFSIITPQHGYTREEVEDELKIDKENDSYLYLEALFCCAECAPKTKEMLKQSLGTVKFMRKSFWSDRAQAYYIVNPDVAKKYEYHSLEAVSKEVYQNEIIA